MKSTDPGLACLAKDIRELLASKFSNISMAMFEYLAEHDSAALVVLVSKGGLSLAGLKFAADALGQCKDKDLALEALLPLLKHSSELVRSSARNSLQILG